MTSPESKPASEPLSLSSEGIAEAWREDATALVECIVRECSNRDGELCNLMAGEEYVLSLVRAVLGSVSRG